MEGVGGVYQSVTPYRNVNNLKMTTFRMTFSVGLISSEHFIVFVSKTNENQHILEMENACMKIAFHVNTQRITIEGSAHQTFKIIFKK